MGPWSWQTRNCYDRYVQRAKLCTDEGAPIHRLAFSLEEALRVASLPGENEGRCYYFRFLRITALPPNGDQYIWLKKVQCALSEMAQHAIHGGDPLAASAGAVFFRSDQEALQALLDHILARRPVTEWFWPMLMPEAHTTAENPSLSAELIPLLVERLRARPASWVAVAAALFGRPEFDVVGFLYSIPPTLAEEWVAEISGVGKLPPSGEAHFSQETLPAIHESARVFGLRSARTLWLVALAILFDCPSKLIVGTAVHHARSALLGLASLEVVREGGRALAADEVSSTTGAIQAGNPAPTSRGEPSRYMLAQVHEVAAEANVVTLPSVSKITEGRGCVDTTTINGAEIAAPASLPGLDISHSASDSPPRLSIDPTTRPVVFVEGLVSRSVPDSEPVSGRWHLSPGLETRAAGLFFLLNGLRLIGIERALADGLARADPHFLPRLLLRLAKSAGVRPDDPVRVWLNALLTDSGADGLTCDRSCWPSNLRPWRDAAPLDYILRVWYLAARRWCWRTAGIPVREVVARTGLFSVNRTDLDVSLQIEQADIRIRRAGLDLDLGWLPWFGRVVRFHYIFHGEFHA